MRRVIQPNRWRYVIVVVVCAAYAFGLGMSGPKWYKAEATLAFKNRTTGDQLDITRLASNPLPIFLEEAPIEQAYELSNIIYSINMADRVIGDRFNELYDPSEYDGIIDFYEKFLLQTGFEYDGDLNVVRLSYTYKDPELAAYFCNRFASSLEDFMIEQVERNYLSPMLKVRIEQARIEALEAEAEVNRISELYGVPDLLAAPRGWFKSYAEAQEKSFRSEAEVRAITAALQEIRKMSAQRNLLEEPASLPDTTISQDIITGALRFRLALIRAVSEVTSESEVEGGAIDTRLTDEINFLEEYLGEQYVYGLNVESKTLLIMLQTKLVENYLYKAQAELTYGRLESLPALEAEVRPAIRSANVARGTVAALERLVSMIELGEEHGLDPVRVIDAAVAPTKPLLLGWTTLAHVLPTMLFLATLWFALAARLEDELEVENTNSNLNTDSETGEK